MTSLIIESNQLVSVFLNATVSFVIAIILAPLLTDFLYKNKVGKRLRQHDINGEAAPIFSKLHADKKGTPVMGGLLFWVTTVLLTLLFNLSREQTWLPVFALGAAGVIGAVDDVMNVLGRGHNGGGTPA